MKSSILLTTLSLFCQILSFAAAAGVKVLTPSEDPFYVPPSGYEDSAPGTILRARIPPAQIRSFYVTLHVKNAWQLLVRSTDSLGNASAVVATILEPYNADPTKLVSYHFAQDSASVNCAPSYSLLRGAAFYNTSSIQGEVFIMEIALAKGWYVVVPDYQGPIAAFTAGRNSGHAALDSIRATLKTNNFTGISSDAKTVMWGYSGGTIPGGWAAALQPTYAPELINNLIGVALGGWVTNITATLEVVDGHLFSGLIPSGINGILQQYPLLQTLFEKYTPENVTQQFYLGKQFCIVPEVIHFFRKQWFKGTKKEVPSGYALFNEPEVQSVLNRETLALHNNTEIPKIPMFVFHGVLDHVVPFSGAQRAYDNYCNWGIKSFEFAASLVSGHITEIFEGTPAAVAWISERFEGKPPVQGCQKTTRLTNLMYPGSKNSTAELLQTLVSSIFGENIGPNGENIEAAQLEKFKRSLL